MEGRRRLTLSEQLSVIDSSNLRDLLKVREAEDGGVNHHRGTGGGGDVVTLARVLACEKRELSSSATGSGSSRTLLDIIRDDDESGGVDGLLVGSSNGGHHKIRWRTFKDRLRHRRASASSAADGMFSPRAGRPVPPRALAVEESAIPLPETLAQPETGTARREDIVTEYNNASVAAAGAGAAAAPPQTGGEAVVGGDPSTASAAVMVAEEEGQQQTIRVSLMTLLEQTDRLGGVDGGGVAAAAVEEEQEMEIEIEESGGGKTYVCCVCMVRHKGAAFIPCGHTFCRLCSRELWISRGNCPLCNGFILEILDIF